MKIAKQSVELVDYFGSDLHIVNAARVSFAKESEWVDEQPGEWPSVLRLSDKDAKLISYLAKHGHWSPFAHNSISLRIKAPIFVARQLVKHQVGLVWNEVSRRYVDDEPEFYFPEVWRGKPKNAKQGSNGTIDPKQPVGDLDIYSQAVVGRCLELYSDLLQAEVAPEQARMVLPQNTMTEWIWTGSLMAFARVCKQRLDPHAQLESREVAKMINDIVEPLFPVSWKALSS